jgi:hypothetical protein
MSWNLPPADESEVARLRRQAAEIHEANSHRHRKRSLWRRVRKRFHRRSRYG